jgi:hypothetical protein
MIKSDLHEVNTSHGSLIYTRGDCPDCSGLGYGCNWLYAEIHNPCKYWLDNKKCPRGFVK